MVRITEGLIHKRAEHNEGEISTLEEIALHQENIEKIEYIDKWCCNLKILLLQSNLIPKIENLSKLKKLEYLNLALNNIEKVENLEGCESLQKLDLTINFIGELMSVETLKNNIHLDTLYLTGNPCTDFEGYRMFVIVTLPQLKYLDGQEIERSERIIASQEYYKIKENILLQQQTYAVKRLMQKKQTEKRIEMEEKRAAQLDVSEEDALKEFWSQVCDHSPETRMQIAAQIQKQEDQKNQHKEDYMKPVRRIYKLFNNEGKPLNINEAKIPFELTEDEDRNCFILDISVYRYLDTCLLDVDLHPNYVKVLIKGKVLQIVFNEEIQTENSTAQRSQTTGHLVLTLPKVNGEVKSNILNLPQTCKQKLQSESHQHYSSRRELLEIGRPDDDMDFSKIVQHNKKHSNKSDAKLLHEKVAPSNFKDNSDVPPLE